MSLTAVDGGPTPEELLRADKLEKACGTLQEIIDDLDADDDENREALTGVKDDLMAVVDELRSAPLENPGDDEDDEDDEEDEE